MNFTEKYKDDDGNERLAILVCADCHGVINRVGNYDESFDVCEDCRNVEGKTLWVDEEKFEDGAGEIVAVDI